MMILEAIERASSEHAIWFLVTAYIESLHHFHRSAGIPEAVVRLPLHGVGDLRHRLEALEPEAAPAEVSAVLASAVQRLDAHFVRENL